MLCYANSCWWAANSGFAFWNFLELKNIYIFYPPLVESADAEPENPEGQLCHKLGGLKIQKLFVTIVEARSLKLRHRHGHTPSANCSGILPCLFQLLMLCCQSLASLGLRLCNAFIVTWCCPLLCLCLYTAIFVQAHQSYWIGVHPTSV